VVGNGGVSGCRWDAGLRAVQLLSCEARVSVGSPVAAIGKIVTGASGLLLSRNSRSCNPSWPPSLALENCFAGAVAVAAFYSVRLLERQLMEHSLQSLSAGLSVLRWIPCVDVTVFTKNSRAVYRR